MWLFTPTLTFIWVLTEIGAYCWLSKTTVAWFALLYWWSSCIWHPHQFWGALVEGIKTSWASKANRIIIWWCSTYAWRYFWHHWEGRVSFPKSEWSRGLTCTGKMDVNLLLELDFPILDFFFFKFFFLTKICHKWRFFAQLIPILWKDFLRTQNMLLAGWEKSLDFQLAY